MKPKQRPAPQTGFTLIELLVVVALIAALLAMTLPLLTSARRRARSAQCLANLKQIGGAISLYSGDYDNAIVPYSIHAPPSERDRTISYFFELLDPYIRSRSTWICPEGDEFTDRGDHPPFDYSYGVNSWTDGPVLIGLMGIYDLIYQPNYSTNVRYDSEITQSESTVSMTEGKLCFQYNDSHDYCANALSWADTESDFYLKGGVALRHYKGFNVLFADGHVQRRLETTWKMWAANPAQVPEELRGCQFQPRL